MDNSKDMFGDMQGNLDDCISGKLQANNNITQEFDQSHLFKGNKRLHLDVCSENTIYTSGKNHMVMTDDRKIGNSKILVQDRRDINTSTKNGVYYTSEIGHIEIDNTETNHTKKLKSVKERGGSTIRGTTRVFIHDTHYKDVSFQILQITSKRISTFSYPDVVAIQTLQFQKTGSNLKGHTCMIKQGNAWKLFFVWDASFANEGLIFGYMYTGKHISNTDIITLRLSERSEYFYWVNLCQNQFPNTVLPQLKFAIKILDGLYFGSHTPSHIFLPKPIFQVQSIESLQEVKAIKVGQYQLHNERRNKIEFYHDYFNTTSYSFNSEHLRRISHHGRADKNCKMFQTKNSVTLPYLTIFQPTSYDIPYQEFLEKSELYIVVPYVQPKLYIDDHPFCIVDYALIDSTKTNMLQGLHENQYNAVLDKIQKSKCSFYQPTLMIPTRFCIVSDEKFRDMETHPKLYSWEALTTTDPEKKGHCCDLKLVNGFNGHTKFLYGITDYRM